MRTSIVAAAVSLAAVFSATLSGCGPDSASSVQVVGRLSFVEDSGCASAVGSQSTSWSSCHLFKRHFTASTGEAVTSGDSVSGALRPLAAAVVLGVYKKDSKGNNVLCGSEVAQSNLDGILNVTMGGCGAGTPVTVTGKVLLQYAMRKADLTKEGTIRAVWPEAAAMALFPSLGPYKVDEGYAYTDDGGKRYAIPQLGFQVDVAAETGTVNLGTQVFLPSESSGDTFNYAREVLSGYQTVLELHNRLRNQYADSDRYFDQMFADFDFADWGPSYTLQFDDDWATGGLARITLYGPDLGTFSADSDMDGRPDGLNGIERLLSSVATLSHEFGHTAHAAMAGASFMNDYGFATPMTRADATDYDWGHGGGQYQELGTSFSEGLASTIGQYLVNGCEGAVASNRPSGGARPFAANMWNGDSSCDTTDGCGYHHVRYHLKARGLEEGSLEWSLRALQLQALTTTATAVGQGYVTSNSESRVSEFGCDLLDLDPDVSFTAGKVGGRSYVSDFTYQVGEILDGRFPVPSIAAYDGDPAPETVQLTLPRLLAAMAGFCPSCEQITLAKEWGASYNTQRLSATGGLLSAQALARFLVAQGEVRRSEMRNLLKSNFMEQDF